MKCSTLFRAMPAIVLGIVMGVFTTSAFAVDQNGLFELEGNAVDNTGGFANLPDDWETLYDNGGSATITTDPKITGGNVVLEDPHPQTIFTMGGSKDPSVIAGWRHKEGAVPDKDDITNAYAANYIEPGSGHQIIYFGADRYANDGDAVMGFWFFQNDVIAAPDGTFDDSFGNPAEHAIGDVFVIANFTGGGLDVLVEILEWDDVTCSKTLFKKDPNCAAENLLIKVPETLAACVINGPQDVCAITNPSGTETSPWTYTPKSGTPGVFPEASFFEGGINISAIFGAQRCFSSFMAESRSSSSPTAQLKDFVLGSFDVCSVTATKVCRNDLEGDDVMPDDFNFDIRGCAWNNGAAEIKIIDLKNDIAGEDGEAYPPLDLVWFEPSEAFDPLNDCDNESALLAVTEGAGTVVQDLSNYTLPPGDAIVYYFRENTALTQPQDTVTIEAEGAADGSPIDPATATDTCPQLLFPAALSVTKSCRADLETQTSPSRIVVKIDVEGQVCNDGDVELTGLFLTDSPQFDFHQLLGIDTLAAGECRSYEGHYYPDQIPATNTCPFSDVVTAKAYADPDYAAVNDNCVYIGSLDLIECTAVSANPTCHLRVTEEDLNCATGPIDPSIQ
ncbi:hypothetical protein ACFL1C_06950 [Pseudomonadota bacterium]